MAARKKTARVGLGYDIHRFRKGRRLVLGGVAVPHSMGLDGHSDADVLCHAVADGLLGAAGLRDIGYHFPNDDPRFRGISSLKLLGMVRVLLHRRKASIVNIDAMLVAEKPRISPFADRMRANIARALGIKTGLVSVKATTNEGLGAVGQRRGIAALAVALVEA